MHHFFTWHPLVMLLCFGVFAVFLYGIGVFCLRRFNRQVAINPLAMPIAVLLSTLATTWSLMFGFAAADVWNMNGRAAQAVSAERSSLTRLLGMAQAEILNEGVLYQQLVRYRSLVIQTEWGQGLNQTPHEQVEQTLQAIRVALLAQAQAAKTPASIMDRMVNDFDELQDARNERLAIGASTVNVYKWYFLVIISILVQTTVAATHADRLQGGRRAVLLYTIMVTLSLFILSLHANPYTGVASISPQALVMTPF